MSSQTKSDSLALIRLDQSHCNYHLSRYLTLHGYQVLFADAGRATRGGSGSQGASLQVFESTGLPIPDLVASGGEALLLIEIDSHLGRALPSLNRYRASATLLLHHFAAISFAGLTHLELGFCRTGLQRTGAAGAPSSAFGALRRYYYFDGPGHVVEQEL